MKAVIAHYSGYGSARASLVARPNIGSLDEFVGMFAEVIGLEQSI